MSKIILILYILATSLALIALKVGTKAGAPIHYLNNKVHFNINAYIVSGMALYGLSFLLYTYLIAKYDLGYIIPLTTAFVYIMIFVASYLIFKESFTPFKITGIALIMAGVVFLNLKR